VYFKYYAEAWYVKKGVGTAAGEVCGGLAGVNVLQRDQTIKFGEGGEVPKAPSYEPFNPFGPEDCLRLWLPQMPIVCCCIIP